MVSKIEEKIEELEKKVNNKASGTTVNFNTPEGG